MQLDTTTTPTTRWTKVKGVNTDTNEINDWWQLKSLLQKEQEDHATFLTGCGTFSLTVYCMSARLTVQSKSDSRLRRACFVFSVFYTLKVPSTREDQECRLPKVSGFNYKRYGATVHSTTYHLSAPCEKSPNERWKLKTQFFLFISMCSKWRR